MTPTGNPLSYRRYRAPREHGAKFTDPPLGEAPEWIAGNLQRQPQVCGPFRPLLSEARRELISLAYRYSARYRAVPFDWNPDVVAPEAPIILAGHQPRLFHPGVWWKNFLIHQLAATASGIAINLIVDNDLGGSAALRVPSGTVDAPRWEAISYDRNLPEIPFEERPLVDSAIFSSFAARVVPHLQGLGIEPLLHDWWPDVVEVARDEPNLGRCLAAARHRLEAAWGLRTLEVPLSQLCETPTFRHFLLLLFEQSRDLHAIYNRCLADYRQLHRIRSRSHPVPELESGPDEWLEMPLWIWTQQDPRRRRLYLRRKDPTSWELSDRHQGSWQIPAGDELRAERGVEALEQLAAEGVKIRPRALVTTLYARMLLSDTFVHGIGGGKYDQLTDAIWQSWLQVQPPAFLVATATVKLPIEREVVSQNDLREVENRLRAMQFNPDRFLTDDADSQALIAEKRDWIRREPARGEGHRRHAALVRINEELGARLARQREELRMRRERLVQKLRDERILGSREIPFCFFPAATLRGLLLDNG